MFVSTPEAPLPQPDRHSRPIGPSRREWRLRREGATLCASDDDEGEDEGDERERDPDVYWRRERDSRSVVEEPAPDEVDAPFGED